MKPCVYFTVEGAREVGSTMRERAVSAFESIPIPYDKAARSGT